MPLPVANWHKIRKEQATMQNVPSQKSRSGKAALQNPSTKPTKAKEKGKKRPLTVEPEVVEVPDSSDSNDSVQYVLDLLKGSTQINDAPINNSSGAKKSKPLTHMNVSAKKRKTNVSKNSAKFNYKQKSSKRKDNETLSQNRFKNSHKTSQKISFRKKKRDNCEGRFKRKTN